MKMGVIKESSCLSVLVSLSHCLRLSIGDASLTERRQNSSLDFYSYMKAESMKKTKVGLLSCEAAKATRSELDVSADGLSSQPMSQAVSAQK